MKIELQVHLEQVDEGRRLVWWARASNILNLTVAADSLRELEFLARGAVEDALADQGVQEAAELGFVLVGDPPETAGDEVRAQRHGGDEVPTNTGMKGQRASRELVQV